MLADRQTYKLVNKPEKSNRIGYKEGSVYHCRVSSRRNCILTFFFIIIIDTIWERIRCSFFHRELDISKHLNAFGQNFSKTRSKVFHWENRTGCERKRQQEEVEEENEDKKRWRKKKRKERQQGDGVRVGGGDELMYSWAQQVAVQYKPRGNYCRLLAATIH